MPERLATLHMGWPVRTMEHFPFETVPPHQSNVLTCHQNATKQQPRKNTNGVCHSSNTSKPLREKFTTIYRLALYEINSRISAARKRADAAVKKNSAECSVRATATDRTAANTRQAAPFLSHDVASRRRRLTADNRSRQNRRSGDGVTRSTGDTRRTRRGHDADTMRTRRGHDGYIGQANIVQRSDRRAPGKNGQGKIIGHRREDGEMAGKVG